MRDVTKEFHKYGDDIPIALVIGSNCPKAVELIEGISSRDGGPFAFRTQLGWCVAGPCLPLSSEGLRCNRIRVRDLSTNVVAKHKLVVKDAIEDIFIGEKLQGMYSNDFNENSSEKKGLSLKIKSS